MNQEITEDQLRVQFRNEGWGALLVRYGFEPYDTESSARRIAEKAAADITELLAACKSALEALRGEGFNAECNTVQQLEKAIANAEKS